MVKFFVYPDIKFTAPLKILYSNECSVIVGDKCSKGLLFANSELQAGNITLPGLSTSLPRLACLTGPGRHLLNSEIAYSSNLYINENSGRCELGLVSYFRSDLDAAYGSWIFPWLISGKRSEVDTLTRSVLFFRSELRTIVSGIVPLQVALLIFLLSLLGNSNDNYSFRFSFFTVSLMALVNGGVLEKAFFLQANVFSPPFKEYLGFLILIVFSLESFHKKPNIKNFLGACGFALLAELLCSGLQLEKVTIWGAIIIGWAALTVATKFSFRSTTFFILNCFFLISVITPYNLVPPYAGTLFFMIYFMGVQVEQIRLRLLNWRINQMSRTVSTNSRLRALIKMIGKVHHIDKVSISLVKNEAFQHWCYTHSSYRPRELPSEKSSSVVSRVYASGKALVNINAKVDPLGQKLANADNEYKSDFFSAFPIQINDQLWGVVSFTGYARSILHKDAEKSFHSSLLECSEIIAKSLSQVTNVFASEFEESFMTSLEETESKSLVEIISPAMQILFEKYKVSSYFSEVTSENNINLLIAKGSLETFKTDINNSSFKVSTANEFGPIALAFKEFEPVVLQNWRPISDKISVRASEIYRSTNAHSIITIPIKLNIASTEFRYLLWLQTNGERVFGSDFFKVSKRLQSRIEQLLENLLNHLVNDTVFSLADTATIKNMVHGQIHSANQQGELLMFDLCNSTKISTVTDASDYQNILGEYRKIVTSKIEPFGYKLQMVIGDALLYTKTGADSETVLNHSNSFIEAIYEAEASIASFLHIVTKNLRLVGGPSVRVCEVYGDISSGIVKGMGGGWAITGSAINEVHKVEAVAKKFRSGFYFTLDSNLLNKTWLKPLKADPAWIDGPQVHYIEFNPSLSSVKSA